jgi:hypothetical protein
MPSSLALSAAREAQGLQGSAVGGAPGLNGGEAALGAVPGTPCRFVAGVWAVGLIGCSGDPGKGVSVGGACQFF